jgi:hypothetical protein
MRASVDRLLGHLGLEREAASLDYLHRLVREHQLRVPFETLTKILDYEPGLARGDFMPPFDEYVERIVSRGGGGLCWTLARGFHVLLVDLGFDPSLMYMDPGHCCVRVELPEGPYYADVGYAAPIFRAYPLFESFTLQTYREKFDYRVRESGIQVTRQPGPTKTLDPAPRTLTDLKGLIDRANDWSVEESFLRRLSYGSYVDGVYVRVRDGVLSRYEEAGLVTTELGPDDVPNVLADVFHADSALYSEAARITRRYLPGPDSKEGVRPLG